MGSLAVAIVKKQWTFQLQKLPVMIDPFFKLMGLLGLPSI
jgi:hypothetical protein